MNQRERMRQRSGASSRWTGSLAASAREHTHSSIELRIDRLVLNGGEFAGHERIAETLKGELANLLTEEGLSNNAAATVREKIDAGTVTLRRGMRMEDLGREIARSIYGGLKLAGRAGRGSS